MNTINVLAHSSWNTPLDSATPCLSCPSSFVPFTVLFMVSAVCTACAVAASSELLELALSSVFTVCFIAYRKALILRWYLPSLSTDQATHYLILYLVTSL